MKHTIENKHLRVQVLDEGAELCSIFDKTKNHEVIWQADPAYWKRHAPVLFPNVGRNYGDTFRVNGIAYPSKQHGFARDSSFICSEKTENSITHQLHSTEESKKVFPADFILEIKHSLSNNRLTVSWKVINSGSSDMYFTIGGHPAFNIPILDNTAFTDYSLGFGDKESLAYILLDTSSGTAITDQTYSLPLTSGTYTLKTDMFDHDALVFDGTQIEKAALLYPDGSPYVVMTCEGFPNFGIWSVPGAPFVCLEPWFGRCDDYGFADDISKKSTVNIVAAGNIFEKSYTIEVF